MSTTLQASSGTTKAASIVSSGGLPDALGSGVGGGVMARSGDDDLPRPGSPHGAVGSKGISPIIFLEIRA